MSVSLTIGGRGRTDPDGAADVQAHSGDRNGRANSKTPAVKQSLPRPSAKPLTNTTPFERIRLAQATSHLQRDSEMPTWNFP